MRLAQLRKPRREYPLSIQAAICECIVAVEQPHGVLGRLFELAAEVRIRITKCISQAVIGAPECGTYERRSGKIVARSRRAEMTLKYNGNGVTEKSDGKLSAVDELPESSHLLQCSSISIGRHTDEVDFLSDQAVAVKANDVKLEGAVES